MGKRQEDPLAGHVSGQSNKPLSRPPHALSYADVVRQLESDEINGLHTAVAKQRLADYGQNDLGEAEGVSALKIVVAQIVNAMTLVSNSVLYYRQRTVLTITGPHHGHGCEFRYWLLH